MKKMARIWATSPYAGIELTFPSSLIENETIILKSRATGMSTFLIPCLAMNFTDKIFILSPDKILNKKSLHTRRP